MDRQPMLSTEEVQAFLDEVFPQQRGVFSVDAIAPMEARISQTPRFEHLRPGGTVSGPTLFTLADCAFYAAVIGMIGREEMTVTTTLTINFMRKPAAGADLTCTARILKLGRTLATGDATIHSDGTDAPVAHATVTYAIPQPRQA